MTAKDAIEDRNRLLILAAIMFIGSFIAAAQTPRRYDHTGCEHAVANRHRDED
jgi:hypothetical protein